MVPPSCDLHHLAALLPHFSSAHPALSCSLGQDSPRSPLRGLESPLYFNGRVSTCPTSHVRMTPGPCQQPRTVTAPSLRSSQHGILPRSPLSVPGPSDLCLRGHHLPGPRLQKPDGLPGSLIPLASAPPPLPPPLPAPSSSPQRSQSSCSSPLLTGFLPRAPAGTAVLFTASLCSAHPQLVLHVKLSSDAHCQLGKPELPVPGCQTRGDPATFCFNVSFPHKQGSATPPLTFLPWSANEQIPSIPHPVSIETPPYSTAGSLNDTSSMTSPCLYLLPGQPCFGLSGVAHEE